eukprot:2795572-Pleurochrysis_carterae.AAC.2
MPTCKGVVFTVVVAYRTHHGVPVCTANGLRRDTETTKSAQAASRGHSLGAYPMRRSWRMRVSGAAQLRHCGRAAASLLPQACPNRMAVCSQTAYAARVHALHSRPAGDLEAVHEGGL